MADAHYAQAYEVWASAHAHASSDDIYDGGFEQEIDATEPGFSWRPTQAGAQVLSFALDARAPYSGTRSLRLEFAGNFDPNVPVLTQLVPVKPRTHYRLSFAARTAALVTGGLPQLSITDAASQKTLATSTQLPPGDSAWRAYDFTFETASDTRAIIVGVTRHPCTANPCPVFGRLWLDAFTLAER